MTPKEKARDLRDKAYLKMPSIYDPTGLPHYPIAKQMALITANELRSETYMYFSDRKSYWEEVIIEIEKL